MLLRNALLFLSRRRTLRRIVERSGLTRRVVRRFVAGETLDPAIAVCHRLRDERIAATLDRLGENVSYESEADASLAAGLEALERARADGLDATVSIKLTQYGLDLSAAACRDRVARLAARAQELGTGIEVDMESSAYVDRTLAVVRDIQSSYGNVRAVIQAYLYRSERDVSELCRDSIPVRLCKGAYLEPPEVAFPSKREVDANYVRLMRQLLATGRDPALATHDARILRTAVEIVKSGTAGVDGRMEFQMLYGVRRDLQRQLVAEGHKVRLYVPYGAAWYPYFMRRLAERPANVIFLAKTLFRR